MYIGVIATILQFSVFLAQGAKGATAMEEAISHRRLCELELAPQPCPVGVGVEATAAATLHRAVDKGIGETCCAHRCSSSVGTENYVSSSCMPKSSEKLQYL